MSRVGMLCVPGTGHLNPFGALGRRLVSRGHDVTMFQASIARGRVKAAGLGFCAIDAAVPPATPRAPVPFRRLRPPSTLDALRRQAERVLSVAPEAMTRLGIDAVIGDQADFAASSVAEHLGLPFVAVSTFPPLYLDPSVPPSIFAWRCDNTAWTRCRNRLGNAVLSAALSPIVRLVNRHRRRWRLEPFRTVNDIFARSPIVAQIPQLLDFPRRPLPSHLFYTGPFHDGRGEHEVSFPWDSLRDRPLVYASMGTVRNDSFAIYRTIADACARLPVQLVLSMGGGAKPETAGPLRGDPIVVHYAPQCALLARAALTITHAGLNTTLESLLHGVPLVAIPVADDQPGVAARIEWSGAGLAVPLRHLTAARLRDAVRRVLDDSAYRIRATEIQQAMRRTNGLDLAADIIERSIARCVDRRSA